MNWKKVLTHTGRWILLIPAVTIIERFAGEYFFLSTRELFIDWFGADFTQGLGFIDTALKHPLLYGWIIFLQGMFMVVAGAAIAPTGKKTVATILCTMRISFFTLHLLPAIESGAPANIWIISGWMIAGAIAGAILSFKDTNEKAARRRRLCRSRKFQTLEKGFATTSLRL